MAKKSSALQIVLDLALARTIVVRDMERRLNSHGIGLSDLALLKELQGSPNYQAQRSELAERLGVTQSGIARQLLPLERIGLVSRIGDAADARKAHVLLTEAGERTVHEVSEDAEDSAATALSKQWTATDQKTLSALVAKVRAVTPR